MIKDWIPSKKWLLVIIIASLLSPINYFVFYSTTQEGYTFNGHGQDDAIFLSLMKYNYFNYENPWSSENRSVFADPNFGSFVVFIPLGYLGHTLGIDYKVMYFFIFKIVLSFLFLIVSYKLIKVLTKNKKELDISFFIFMFAAGLGGLVYLPRILDPASILENYSFFGMGIGTFRIIDSSFRVLPFITTIMSLIYVSKGDNVKTCIFVFLTTLIYPVLGFYSAFIAISWNISKKKIVFSNLALVLAFLFGYTHWFLGYLADPEKFNFYTNFAKSIDMVFLPSLIFSLGVAGLLAFYFINKDSKKYFLWIFSIIIFTIGQAVNNYWITQSGILNSLPFINILTDFSLLLQIPLLILLIVKFFECIKIKECNFIHLILYGTLLLALAPQQYVFWLTGRLQSFIWFPVSILAAYGALKISQNLKIDFKKLLALILLVSLPSFFFYYAFSFAVVKDNPIDYYNSKDIELMKGLQNYPYGTVLSPPELGTYLPYYSHKKAFISLNGNYVTENYENKLYDYYSFNKSPDYSIIKKYNISYVLDYKEHETNFLKEINMTENMILYKVDY